MSKIPLRAGRNLNIKITMEKTTGESNILRKLLDSDKLIGNHLPNNFGLLIFMITITEFSKGEKLKSFYETASPQHQKL